MLMSAHEQNRDYFSFLVGCPRVSHIVYCLPYSCYGDSIMA